MRENIDSEELSQEYGFMSKILRVWLSINGKQVKDLITHLKYIHNIKISSQKEASQILHYPTYARIKAFKSQMTSFIIKERASMVANLYLPQEFGSSNKVDFQSFEVMLSSVVKKNDSFVSFGVIVDFSEWNTPLIQMHFDFLNRISREIDFTNRNVSTERPVQRRVYFIPYTEKEFQERIKNDSFFQEQITFFTKLCILNSVTLNFIPVDVFYKKIVEGKDFFLWPSHLKYLGFSNTQSLALRKLLKKNSTSSTEVLVAYGIIKDLLRTQIYSRDKLYGLNFINFNRKFSSMGIGEVWAYLYNLENGLRYKIIDDSYPKLRDHDIKNILEAKIFFASKF